MGEQGFEGALIGHGDDAAFDAAAKNSRARRRRASVVGAAGPALGLRLNVGERVGQRLEFDEAVQGEGDGVGVSRDTVEGVTTDCSDRVWALAGSRVTRNARQMSKHWALGVGGWAWLQDVELQWVICIGTEPAPLSSLHEPDIFRKLGKRALIRIPADRDQRHEMRLRAGY